MKKHMSLSQLTARSVAERTTRDLIVSRRLASVGMNSTTLKLGDSAFTVVAAKRRSLQRQLQ